MRVTLTEEQFFKVCGILRKEDFELYMIFDENGKKAYTSDKKFSKFIATKKATEIRKETARKKIENAINLLRLQGAKITQYSIAKESGCSVNTVKKYHNVITN